MYQTDILYEYHVWIYRGRGEGCPALTVLILFIHKLILQEGLKVQTPWKPTSSIGYYKLAF